mmetsp:Transcript_22873/g.46805  ORF Transcript_22873/g.46805 Transcript_22873/m.46805 type:complete len:310 (+) Transcript_22873:142-1071(+)
MNSTARLLKFILATATLCSTRAFVCRRGSSSLRPCNHKIASSAKELKATQDRKIPPWERAFSQLVTFKREHGHCRVPNSFTYSADASDNEVMETGTQTKPILLGRWVERQRASWSKGSLGEVRSRRLEEMGFVWDPFQDEWDERYRMLQAFHEAEGHCRVPQHFDVVVVMNEKTATSSPEPKAALGVGEVGRRTAEVTEGAGGEMIRGTSIHDTEEEEEDCIMILDECLSDGSDRSSGNSGGVAHVVNLGSWVATQRVFSHKGRLSEERRGRLERLGFLWSAECAERLEPFPPRRMVVDLGVSTDSESF